MKYHIGPLTPSLAALPQDVPLCSRRHPLVSIASTLLSACASIACTLLKSLASLFATPILCFQSLADSFTKIGGGVPPALSRHSPLCTIFVCSCYDPPQMDELGRFTEWLWPVTAIGQALLLCLLVARKNASSYKAFSVYIFMTLAQSGLLFVAIRRWGFSSSVGWRIVWATQFLVLGARAFAVAELCRHILGRFRGVWLLARWILLSSGRTVLL